MDAVDRMYRHLVRTIRSRFPQYLTQPFDVTELYTTILPYRHHRRELGIETNEDYEITLTELLSGGRDYLIVDDGMRDALRSELGAVNPDPGAFKRFAGHTVALSPAALRSLDAGPADEASPPARPTAPTTPAVVTEKRPVSRATAPASVTAAPSQAIATPAPRAPTPSAPSAPTPSAPPPTVVRLSGSSVPGTGAIVPEAGDRCRACDEVLPPGRPITFCPHCGQNVTTINCAACGSELEVNWKFCPTCGRPAPAA